VKIHIIDDNPDIRAIYEGLFNEAGYEVRVSGDGLSGISDVVDFKPDIVLLDILMPEMSGYEFLQALRKSTSIAPLVIACSNLSEQIDIDRALRAGAHFYLRKSDFVGKNLVEEVERLYKSRLG